MAQCRSIRIAISVLMISLCLSFASFADPVSNPGTAYSTGNTGAIYSPDGSSEGDSILVRAARYTLLLTEYTSYMFGANQSSLSPVYVQLEHGYASLPKISSHHLEYNDDNTNGLRIVEDVYYGTFLAQISFIPENILYSLKSVATYMLYWLDDTVNPRQEYSLISWTFDDSGENFSISYSINSVHWYDYLSNRIEFMITVLYHQWTRFFEWFYPLDDVDPEYWRYYNTDTQSSENIGLAGLMYNISWYLGQLYVLQSASAALDDMTDQVEAVSEQLEEVEAQESAIVDTVTTNIESFIPDASNIGALSAIGWLSTFLQNLFVSLGAFNVAITVGLAIPVCMQFIGYFRYKH